MDYKKGDRVIFTKMDNEEYNGIFGHEFQLINTVYVVIGSDNAEYFTNDVRLDIEWYRNERINDLFKFIKIPKSSK